MSWPEIAAEHFGHRAVLRSVDTLECVDCARKLTLPLRPDLAPTKTPPRWKHDPSQAASPETVARYADLARKNLVHVKQRRQEDQE